jgi:succinyl-diaminopimelate desuccinylase
VAVPQALWDPGDATVYGERVNLIAARRTGRPVCSLYFHVDAVPPGDGWTRPPFRLTAEGRTLYGRGTADMKATIASALAALRAAQSVDLPLASIRFCYCARTKKAGFTQASVIWPSRGS